LPTVFTVRLIPVVALVVLLAEMLPLMSILPLVAARVVVSEFIPPAAIMSAPLSDDRLTVPPVVAPVVVMVVPAEAEMAPVPVFVTPRLTLPGRAAITKLPPAVVTVVNVAFNPLLTRMLPAPLAAIVPAV